MGDWRNSMFGAIVMMTWAVLTVPLTVIAILLAAPFLGPRRAFFSIGPWFMRGMAWFCHLPFRLHGWEQMPEAIRTGQQPVIFMSNHESQLDPPLLIAALPLPAVYIAKKEVKYMPFVGWAAMLAGVIFIDRSNREKAIESLRAAALEIRGGKNAVYFPEGTRSPHGALLPFKKGGFALALEAGVPIIPIAIEGTFRALPKGSLRFRPARLTVLAGAPIDPAAHADRDALLTHTQARIQALVAEARGIGAQ